MGRCLECGKDCKGVLVSYDSESMYIPDLCDDCLFKLTTDQHNLQEDPGIICPKCKAEVPLLREKECIDCYNKRCDVMLTLPTHIEDVPPPLGWLYTAQELLVSIEYDSIKSRNHKRLEC